MMEIRWQNLGFLSWNRGTWIKMDQQINESSWFKIHHFRGEGIKIADVVLRPVGGLSLEHVRLIFFQGGLPPEAGKDAPTSMKATEQKKCMLTFIYQFQKRV